MGQRRKGRRKADGDNQNVNNTAVLRPTDAQRHYLALGVSQPGGKLPLRDRDGHPVPPKIIATCIRNGWAERWVDNPVQPDWLVCRLTPRGRRALNQTFPSRD